VVDKMKKMTTKSLEEAFAGESMAHMKYLIFAEEAERAGKPNIARMFRAIAHAEFVHAKNHAKNLGYIGDTLKNLNAGLDGETFEIEEMYPSYNAIAKLQDEKGAMQSIHYAESAEKIHQTMYKDAIKAVEEGNDTSDENIYVCPVCGYTHIGEPPEKCPVCGVSSDKFEKF